MATFDDPFIFLYNFLQKTANKDDKTKRNQLLNVSNQRNIMKCLNRLLICFDKYENYVDSFVQKDGIECLTELLALICSHASIDSIRNSQTSDWKGVEEIIHFVLLTFNILINQNRHAATLIGQNLNHCLDFIFRLFHYGFQRKLDILILKILSGLCRLPPENVVQVLERLNITKMNPNEVNHFDRLAALLDETDDKATLIAILDFINELLSTEAIDMGKLIKNFKKSGLTLHTFKMKVEQIDPNQRGPLWERIERFQFLSTMEYNNEMDSIEIRFEMKQLSDSLNKLQIEKKNLLTIEKNLKSRYEMLIKNYMQGNRSSLVDSLTSFGTQQPDSLLSIIVDDNVKSSEEEMVYASMAVRPQLSPSCESNGTNMRPDSIDSISMMMSLIGDCYVPISRSEITSKRLAQFESVDNGQDNELENNEINVCDQPSPPTDTHKCDAFRTNFILRKKNDFGCR